MSAVCENRLPVVTDAPLVTLENGQDHSLSSNGSSSNGAPKLSSAELYQHWANSILCEVGIIVDAIEEFQNGALLAVLVDLLWTDAQLQKKLQEEGLGEELNQETALQCTTCVLSYVQEQGVKISISAHDIIDGDVKSLLDLLWVLILHFTIHSPDVATHLRTVKCGKRKILEWCGQALGGRTLDSGQSLAANLCTTEGLIARLICQICEVPENPDPLSHLTNALLAAEEQLGISKHILDPFSALHGNVEEHSLLVYMALLRRKAQLIEDLAPHEKAPAQPSTSGLPAGAGMSQQWSSYPLPPEAVQAMGLDSGDYVMYAIVEEHFIPPEALEAFQGQFDMLPGYNRPDKPSTVKISEIFSEDEAGSGHNSGAESPGSRRSPGPTVTVTQLSPRLSTESREDPVQAYFTEKEAKRQKERAEDPNLKYQKHREFPDAGSGDGRPINPVPWRIDATSTVPTENTPQTNGTPLDITDSESVMEEDLNAERQATRAARLRQSSSDFSSDDRVQESIFEEIQRAEKEVKKKKKQGKTKAKSKSHEMQETRPEEVEEALHKSESVRASIAEMLAGMSSLTGEGGEVPENMSDEDVVATMTAMRNMLSNQTGATVENGETRINGSGNLDETVIPRDRGKLSNSTDSLEAVRDGSAPASLNDSGDLFHSEDELLDLLEKIGQQGEDMRSELENAYAREVVLTHSKINEDDSMAEVINKLKNEIEQLRAEGNMDMKNAEKKPDDSETVAKLKKTISDLRGKVANLKSKKESTGTTKKTPLLKSTGTLTERLVAVNEASQTVGSFFRMNCKSCQTTRLSTADRSLQVNLQPFTRSRFTSTADLNISVVKINSCTQTNAITNADISYYEKQLLNMGHNSHNESASRPKRVHKKMLDKMIQHISDVGKDPAAQAALLEQLEGFGSLAENVEKWQQLSMIPVNDDPILLHFQRSLACAAFENRLLQAELQEGPKNADIMKIKENMELARPYNSKNIVNKFRSGNGVVPELDQLKERITSLEQTLTNAQVDNNKLTSKLEEALQTVKENIETNPQRMSGMERENHVLMKRLMKVETEREQLEESIEPTETTIPPDVSEINHTGGTSGHISGESKSKQEKDLQRLQTAKMNSPDVVCGIENSLADIRTERQQLEAEVTALREEYEHIRRGMEMMTRYAPQEETANDAVDLTKSTHAPAQEASASRKDAAEDVRIKRLVELMEREFSHRDQRKHSSEDHLAETKVTKSKASEVRGRAPTKTSPTRPKDERSNQVQKELDKRFPRSRSNSNSSAPRSTSRSRTKSRSPSASNRVKSGDKEKKPPTERKSTESASLVDHTEVRDMGIEELRKKRLAMLIESYTSHTNTDSLRRRMEGIEGATAAPSGGESLPIHLASDTVFDDNAFDPLESSSGHRRKLPYIPMQKSGDHFISDSQSDCLSLPMINQKSDAEFTSLPITNKETTESNESRPYFMRARRQQVSAKAGSQSRSSMHSTTDSGVSDVGSQERAGRERVHRDDSPNLAHSTPTQARGPYLHRTNDLQKAPTPRSAWTGSAKSTRPNTNLASTRANLDKAPWSKTKPTPQTLKSNPVSSKSPLEESDSVSTSSSVRELITSLNQERTKPDGTAAHSSEYSDGVFPSMDDTEESPADLPKVPASKRSGRESTSSRKDRSPSSSSPPRRKKHPPWKQAALSSAKRTEYSDSSTDKSDEYWKEHRRYERYSRRAPDRSNSESPQRTAPWTSKPRSQQPLLASAPLPEISRVQPAGISSLTSPRYLANNLPNKTNSASTYRPSRDLPSPRIRDLSSPRTTPRDLPSPRDRTTPRDPPRGDRATPRDPTPLLDDPGNLRHYERAYTDSTNLVENNSAPVNLKNLSRTSDRIPTVGTYADTLINRYSSHYSSSSGTRRNKNDPLFSNENDYVNHLLDKYSKSSWRK